MTRRSVVAPVTLVALVLTLGACSQDKHVFRSTVFSPKTIELRDMVSRRVIWSKEVPVGYELVLDFDTPYEKAPFRIGTEPPTKLTWHMKRVETDLPSTIEKGKVKLPGVNVIMEVTIRDVPEYPPGYSPGPPPATSQPVVQPVAEVHAPPREKAPEPEPQPKSPDDAQDPAEPVDPAMDKVLDE